MTLKLTAFGIAKDILGKRVLEINLPESRVHAGEKAKPKKTVIFVKKRKMSIK